MVAKEVMEVKEGERCFEFTCMFQEAKDDKTSCDCCNVCSMTSSLWWTNAISFIIGRMSSNAGFAVLEYLVGQHNYHVFQGYARGMWLHLFGQHVQEEFNDD
jgi:hypothetical protein